MYLIFLVLFFIFLVLLVVSLINPKAFKNRSKEPFTRKQLLQGFGTLVGVSLILLLVTFPKGSSSQVTKPKFSPVQSVAGSLDSTQKAQVVAIISENTDHFKKLWQDGKTALGTTPYPDAEAGLVALNDPTSNASQFSKFKQTENPANDNSMNDALSKADKYYNDSNTSDDALNTWRLDMIQLSSDMGIWVQDATNWQTSTLPITKLNNDEQAVNKDFNTVQKDITSISSN